MKAAKRILTNNCDTNGNIDNDLVSRALLQYRNTPLKVLNLSPAQILYGRMLRDHTPSLPDLYKIRPEWRLQADARELALQKRNSKIAEQYNAHTRALTELDINDHVAVQNQHGSYPRRWDKTGKVVEKLEHRQYNIRMDGSGRITLRNRKFLKKIEPICSDPPLRLHERTSYGGDFIPSDHLSRNSNRSDVSVRTVDMAPVDMEHGSPSTLSPERVVMPIQDTPVTPSVRRSTRMKQPRELLTMNPYGTSHIYEKSAVIVNTSKHRLNSELLHFHYQSLAGIDTC